MLERSEASAGRLRRQFHVGSASPHPEWGPDVFTRQQLEAIFGSKVAVFPQGKHVAEFMTLPD